MFRNLFNFRSLCTAARTLTEGEKAVVSKLQARFQSANVVEAEDISGGCGTMFRVRVDTGEFAGKLKVQQHKMVTECLKEDIKNWHGLVIDTKAT